MTRLNDIIAEKDFADLLDAAESSATTEWEMTFVSDLQDKFREFGRMMFLSEKQLQILERLGEGQHGSDNEVG